MASYQRKGNWFTYQVTTQEEGQPFSSLAQDRFNLSDSILRKLIAQGGCEVNGKPIKLTQSVQKGDRVHIRLFAEEPYGVPPEFIPIEIMFEDEHILVVHKAAGIAVHPTEVNQGGTLANAVAYHYQLHGQQIKVRHVHRLDKDTSGVLLIAKHAIAHAILDEMLRERRIRRFYLAVTTGTFKTKKGTIEAAIGRDRHHATRRRVSPKGDAAVTHYRVIEQYHNAALLELELETGRTHQIRVHLSHIGHPLYGDTLYGGPAYPVRRQALHGARLQFEHPITREMLDITAPLPEDMQRLLTYLQQE